MWKNLTSLIKGTESYIESKRNSPKNTASHHSHTLPWKSVRGPRDKWFTALCDQGRVASSHCLAKGLIRHDHIFVCYEWIPFGYELPRSLSPPHYAPSSIPTLICHLVHSVWCLTYGKHTHKLYSSAQRDHLQLEHVLCCGGSPMEMIQISMFDLCNLFN